MQIDQHMLEVKLDRLTAPIYILKLQNNSLPTSCNRSDSGKGKTLTTPIPKRQDIRRLNRQNALLGGIEARYLRKFGKREPQLFLHQN